MSLGVLSHLCWKRALLDNRHIVYGSNNTVSAFSGTLSCSVGFPLTWKVGESQEIDLVKESLGISLVVKEKLYIIRVF